MAITQQQLFTKGASSANNGNNQSLTKVSGENKKDIEKGIQNNTNLSSNQNVKTKNNNKENQTMASADLSEPLHIAYPVNTIMELTLAPPHDEVVRGLVYTTDEISNSIVLKRSLPHTTITCEIRILNASSVINKKVIQSQNPDSGNIQNSSIKANESSDASTPQQHDGTGGLLDSAPPLPAVSKKSLDERERRALKLAEESFAHINQKASPEGQAVFDRLLKACNEVVWKDKSIFVLNQIRVDPPYTKDDCKLIVDPSSSESQKHGGSNSNATESLNEGSLDRVKKIVASTAVGATSSSSS